MNSEERTALEPFIAGEMPDDRGEVQIYCPLHDDARRSASLNVERDIWCCHAGCGGGSVKHLVASQDSWVSPDGRVKEAQYVGYRGASEQLSNDAVTIWHRRLIETPRALAQLEAMRGINEDTARRARLGFDGLRYKIPVYGPDRSLLNVRTYDPSPIARRRKIWSARGHGQARLYPIGVLLRLNAGSSVLMCEGEFDTLLALQHGQAAVTRTDGAGKPWHDEWTDYFAGLCVYLCHDRDRAGSDSDRVTLAALGDVAEVYRCELPYAYRPKHGKDLTDFLMDDGDLHKLMEDAICES